MFDTNLSVNNNTVKDQLSFYKSSSALYHLQSKII